MGTSTGALTRGALAPATVGCRVVDARVTQLVCQTCSVSGLVARMTHHATMAAEFQAKHPRPHPLLKGRCPLWWHPWEREAASSPSTWTRCVFFTCPLPNQSLEAEERNTFIPKQWVKAPPPTSTSWLQIWRVDSSKENWVIWVAKGRARSWEKTNKLSQWYVHPRIW